MSALNETVLQDKPYIYEYFFVALHCLKWLKFNFFELENSRLFAEFVVPIGRIIFLGL